MSRLVRAMTWMQVERATLGPCVLFAGFLLMPVVPAVWWYAGWEYGVGTWLGVLFVLSVYYFPTGVVGRLRAAAARKVG